MNDPVPMSEEELVRIATELDEKLTDEQKLQLAAELNTMLDAMLKQD